MLRPPLFAPLLAAAFASVSGAAADGSWTRIDLAGLDASRAIAGTTAAGTPAAYANRGAVRAFDGSGTGADGLAHGTAADGAMFMLSSNDSGSFPFYLQAALGETRRIDRVRIFNFNFVKNGVSYTERGVRNFQLYASDGAAWGTSVAAIRSNYAMVLSNALDRASGTADYAGETFDLPEPVSARFVALVALDDGDGGGFVAHRHSAFRERGAGRGGHRERELQQVHRFEFQGRTLGAGQRQEVLDEERHPAGLVVDTREHHLHVVGRAGAVQLRVAADGGQGGA